MRDEELRQYIGHMVELHFAYGRVVIGKLVMGEMPGSRYALERRGRDASCLNIEEASVVRSVRFLDNLPEMSP